MKKLLAAAFSALAVLLISNAAAPQQRPGITVTIPTPSGLLSKFNTLVLSDVQNAEAIAKAAGDTIADQCYVALIALIQQMQTVAGAPAGSTAAKLPTVALVTDFQKARLLLNAQRSTSPVFAACAPLKAQMKQDALQAPGALLGLF